MKNLKVTKCNALQVRPYSATIRKNLFGEWQVRFRDSEGARMPECDYFTNDKQDAIDTMNLTLMQ